MLLQAQHKMLKRTPANGKKIDELVYRLYDLTPEEIKIIEGGE